LIDERAASGFAVEAQPSTGVSEDSSRRSSATVRDRRSIQVAGHGRSLGLQDGELVGQRLHAVGTAVLGGGEFPGRDIQYRNAKYGQSFRTCRERGAIAMRNAGSRASR